MRFLQRVFTGTITAAGAGATVNMTENAQVAADGVRLPDVFQLWNRLNVYVDGTIADESKVLSYWTAAVRVGGKKVAALPLNRCAGLRPLLEDYVGGGDTTNATEAHAAARGTGELGGLPIPSEDQAVTLELYPTGVDTAANSAPAADTDVCIVVQYVEDEGQ